MSSGTPSNANATLLKRWANVLEYWQKKRSQYEAEKARTSDPARQLEHQQGIETCQAVIDTCQGLIQILSNRASEGLSLSLAAQSSPTMSKSMSVGLGDVEIPAVETNPPVLEAIDPVAPLMSPPSHPKARGTQARGWGRPPSSTSPIASVIWRKRILGGALPVLLFAAAFMALFRPRDVCKIAPDGSYSRNGLSLQVRQALTATQRYAGLTSISVSQNGCTIVLKGTVPSQQVADELIQTVQTVQVPSQTFVDRLKQRFTQNQRQWVEPVEAVKSELKVISSSPQTP